MSKRLQSFPHTFILVTAAVVAGVLAFKAASITKDINWFGLTENESSSFTREYLSFFFASLLMGSLFSLFWKKTRHISLLVAVITTAAMIMYAKIALIVAFAALFGSASQLNISLTSIAGGLFIAVLTISHFLSRRTCSRTVNAAQISISALALLALLVPWKAIFLGASAVEKRQTAAQESFGPTYALAVKIINSCEQLQPVTGALQQLDISTRRNSAQETPYFTAAYYDFDYVGEKNSGRLTIQVNHLKAIGTNDPNGNDPRQESFKGSGNESDYLVFIYPEYVDTWINATCPSLQ